MSEPLPPLYLAPMAEFTSPPMRVLCEQYGAQRTYTEMVNAEGICRNSAKTLFLLETFPEERHVWAHLYGHDPARLAEAAQIVAAMGRFEGIDLNAGCPVPRITSQGAGSALLKDLPRLEAIVSAVVNAVKLPVSVKTRLGPNPQVPVWREVLQRMEAAGATSVTLHARYTSQGHAGTVHLDTLKAAVEATSLPIFGNGSVVDRATAEAMAATGVKAILIARAALETPAVFQFERGNAHALTEDHLALELRYREKAQAFSRLSPEEATVLTFRRHIFRYFKGLPGANSLRGNLMNLHTLDDIRHAIAAIPGA
ncbi:MAG: tRNA-dihydrouridine synthase family protein [Kiritimatiellae bacterium]|nr:tRNA-dihydrouridine synthase family protein [Kiritimatiellia bacterium]